MIPIYSSPKMTDIIYIQSLLDNENIETFIENEHLTGIMPHLSYALGNIKLMVNEKDLDAAKKIITKNPFKKFKEEYIKTDKKSDKCPKCSSPDFEKRKLPSDEPNVIMTFLSSVATFKNKKYFQCNKCKSYWDIVK